MILCKFYIMIYMYYLFDSYTIWYTRHTCKYIHRIIEKLQKVQTTN